MNKELLIKNLRYLIDSDEFSQTSIALMFGEKQSTFNECVNGKRIEVPIRILEKFSFRYNVTIDDLLYKDLSEEYEVLDNFDSEKNSNSLKRAILPLLSPRYMFNNTMFEEAFELTEKAFKCENIKEFNKNICIYEHAIDLYRTVWEETKNCEVLANSISLLLWIFYRYTPSTIRLERSLNKKGVFGMSEIRQGLLNDLSEDICDNYERKRSAFLKKYYDLVYDYIKELKHNLEYVDLGDFYLTLCNIFHFVEDPSEYSRTTCNKAAEMMLIQQYYMGNKYTIQYLYAYS
ncbi:MAG: hypothetical protein IKT46_00570 [Clostridia bacterium]|nr:hypothetical protein [Clostridia bacterium]